MSVRPLAFVKTFQTHILQLMDYHICGMKIFVTEKNICLYVDVTILLSLPEVLLGPSVCLSVCA
jgi:hypothetical protein